MQRLRIQHVTEYLFSQPVTLNCHRLLLRPREGHDVRIESSRLDISPTYAIQWYRDVFDNSLALVRFQQTSNRLRIGSDVVIQHYEDPVRDIGADDFPLAGPFGYEAGELADLAAYQRPIFQQDQPALQCWLREIGLKVQTLNALNLQTTLNRAIHDKFQYRIREEAGVQSPLRTLHLGSGSCRDYATLFIEACRSLGLASRFVSGYLHAPATEAGNASTHAWAEVYFPGIGWQGFDPTVGQMTGNRHIAVAVARNPETVPPVSGSFIGPRQISTRMLVNVQVNLLR
ncbi:transglutaminase family protein [Methylomonas sp. MED-D]|uniref:Cysteine protease n=1 Tax=Methylomonas koyamae TaxID=702114 RepID=A0A177P0X4_9GAMM|nr:MULTISPECIES: transglutaminase family protein [Methylomonas]MDT4328679.1 transglutaminase family protein [Methylomonas sp. MV1]OAI22980.1 cysteine protease [Methylomonas koyamae]OHX34445.1 cysteine protease [Methylomonas sp. LWB]WGS88088.1 transglutaminase family protein [Methylomonas sp. UP202]